MMYIIGICLFCIIFILLGLCSVIAALYKKVADLTVQNNKKEDFISANKWSNNTYEMIHKERR